MALGNTSATNSLLTLTDVSATNLGQRFYRLVEQLTP